MYQAENKSDRLMVNAAVTDAREFENKNVVVVGDELDLLVLLIYHSSESDNIFMLRPGKKTTRRRTSIKFKTN